MPDKMEKIKDYYEFILPLVLQAGKVSRFKTNKNNLEKPQNNFFHENLVLKVLINVEEVDIEFKKDQLWDLVTIYDKKIEDVLIKKIKEKYPAHKHIGEEETERGETTPKLTDDPTWIIDPIDGTANFVRKMPITCISVGLVINKIQVMGVVYNPYMNELYTAFKGQGAFLNGERIYTSGCKEIRKSVMNYEISVARRNQYYYDLYMFRLKHLIKIIQGIRSMGCVVLGLCYVACGRTDAYQCDGLFPWDAAAATLIVTEAGGHVTDSSGKEFDLMDPNFLAAATRELSDQYMEVERIADEEQINSVKQNRAFTP